MHYLLQWTIILFMIDSKLYPRYPEEIVVSYLSPDTKEEAQLVRLKVSNTAYNYKIRIANRYQSAIYHDIQTFVWSPDSKHFYLLVERQDGKIMVVQDGMEHYSDFDKTNYPIWSNDSRQLVYWGWTSRNKEFTVMWNGAPIKKYQGITSLFFDKNNRLVVEGTEL